MVDGTKELPSLGQKMVHAEWSARGGKKLSFVSQADLDRIVKRLIQQRSNTTASELETRIAAERKAISLSLSRLIKAERHLHRERVRTGKQDARGHALTEYTYWFDESVDNPDYGKIRLTKAKEEAPPEPEPTPVDENAPISIEDFALAVQTVNSFKEERGDALELAIIDDCLCARIVQTFK